jgi:hypothetical protein
MGHRWASQLREDCIERNAVYKERIQDTQVGNCSDCARDDYFDCRQLHFLSGRWLDTNCGHKRHPLSNIFRGIYRCDDDKLLVEEDSLIITSNFKRSKFARSSLVAVSYAKGCPVSLERAEGGWIHLPGTIGGLGLVNTLRTWLKRSSQNVERESSEREAATTPS